MGTWFGREKKPAFLSIDLETRSEVDLGKCGVYKYVEGEHWGILLFCYLFEGDEDVSEVDMASGEPLPEDVLAALEDPEITKYAWNASFERTNLSKHLGRRLDPRQWKCTMVWAAELSIPLSLKNAAAVLKVDQQKDRAGDALIRKFSVPQKPTKSNGMKEWLGPSDLPEQWAAFKSYCRQDVRTEDAIRRRLEKFPLPMSEWEMYWIDQDINDRGIKIDLDLARAAMECDRQMGGKMMDEARELTGLENPNSVQQMKGWLGAHNTFLATLGKEEVQEMISQMEGDPDADRDALRMLKLRLQMAKSSIKKYEAAVRCTCEDGRARGLFQFYGASRTGRFAGRHIQLQNLSKNHVSYLDDVRSLIRSGAYDALDLICGNVPDILSQCVRTMLVPKPGHEFIVADFSAIEARCIAWEAGEESVLKDFRDGKDLYCATASRMFGVPVEKHGQNAELRQKGKVAVLACLMRGSLVLTDKGLIPIEDVTLDMKLWDGEEWVSHRGVVYKGTRKVYRWGGISATADHPFLTAEDDFRPESYKPFRDIWSSDQKLMFCMGETEGKPMKLGDGFTRGLGPAICLGLKDVYDIVDAGPRHRFTVSGVLVHNCGYGGSAGAMTSMGALKMGLKEEELPDIVQAYRDANPNIVKFWWDLDNAATRCIRDHQDHEAGPVRFELRSNVLWMVLPSGRSLAYIAPRIGKNRFGGKSIEFMGVGLNNKWQTIETYGAKLSENCLREGTLVLTRANGWKPIEQIGPEDELWDGEEWVPTKGSIYKGDHAVIEVSFAHHGGIYMTPDHRILTDDGWTEAGNADGRCWKEAGIPDSQAFREKLPGYRTRPTGWNRISIYRWSSVYQDVEIAPVYDIVDCGPRSRFCVLDPGTGDLRIVHNCTQAIARDILCNSIRNLEAEGIHVVAHVHDECICEVPIGRYSVDDICSIMARNPEWCRDLPLTAAGYLAPDYYYKD